MTLRYGEARITTQGQAFRVDYRNVGNGLADGNPKFFRTHAEALDFCQHQTLRVVR